MKNLSVEIYSRSSKKKDGLHYLKFLEINIHTMNVVIISAHIVSKPDEKCTK
jgi:hypothetical protein